jgi:hypothetical protein
MNPVTEVKQGEVQQMMSLIQERVMEVRDVTEELAKRLAPIRRSDPPAPIAPAPIAPDEAKGRSSSTPLTGMMIDQVASLKISIEQMKAILRTLEL